MRTMRLSGKPSVMPKVAVACLTALTVTSCDPGVHIAYRKDFDQQIDPACVERALRTVSPKVQRGSYVSDGADTRNFGKGTAVTQFLYPDPVNPGEFYTVDLAALGNGKTGFYHGWGTLGTEIPPEQRAKVLPLLRKANDAVAQQCELTFIGTEPQVGPG